jgi:hypothetical protein
MELKIIPNIKLENDIFTILFEFDVPDNTSSGVCAIENPTCMGVNDTLLLSTSEITDISDILKFEDKIIGDTNLLKVDKTFRFSTNNYNFTDWAELNDANIKAICGYEQVYIQFRYVACSISSTYNLEITPITKPNTDGWFQLHTGDDFYKFENDYPQDDIEYHLGFGTQGQFHYDDVTDRFHYKNNGFWSSPYTVQRNETTSGIVYVPSKLGGVEVNDVSISNSSTGGFVPIDDYYLKDDIRFGKTLALSSSFPMKDDYIYINQSLQGFGNSLHGVETLFIKHSPRTLPENYDPKIWLESICIEAKQSIPIVEGNTVEPIICLDGKGDQVIFNPNMVLKVYSLDSYCLVVDGLEGTNCCVDCLDIKFRHSSTTRKWENGWLPLTEANLKCIKPSALKFFYIEFLFTQTCDNGGKPICITDLIINGDYQNVSNDYEKLNRFGLRPDCNYKLDEEGTTDNVYQGEDSGVQPPIEWTDDNSVCPTLPSFNPYDANLTNHLNEKLSNDISNLFGHQVDYYKVEANNAGIDNVLHEYQTYDTTQKEVVKVLVPDNNFPEDIVGFNMFDLALFDSFEIHITRKEFHNKFGIGVRPGNKDFLFFCPLNKWYEVEHAQSFREYNNISIYYKVTLTKKSDDKNIDNRAYENEFSGLIQNNSLDNLFQSDVEENEDQVVNKQIQENLTETFATDVKIDYDDKTIIENTATMDNKELRDVKKPDPIDLSIFATNIEQDLINGPNVISRNYYDFTSRTNDNALVYKKLDNTINECDDRSFMVWFKINKYIPGQVYNMIDNYNTVIKNGYKIDFVDGRFEIIWFGQMFDIDVSVALNKWHSVLVNFNQKEGKLELFLYTRRDDGLCSTDELVLISEHETKLVPISFSGDLIMSVKGSPMSWTNMRIFNEVVTKNRINLILNQYIIKNTELLVIADNINKVVISPSWKY